MTVRARARTRIEIRGEQGTDLMMQCPTATPEGWQLGIALSGDGRRTSRRRTAGGGKTTCQHVRAQKSARLSIFRSGSSG